MIRKDLRICLRNRWRKIDIRTRMIGVQPKITDKFVFKVLKIYVKNGRTKERR